MNRPYKYMLNVGALSVLVLSCLCSNSALAAEPRAFILHSGNQTVTAVDMEKGAVQGSLSLSVNATRMMHLPHSQKLVVIDSPVTGDRKSGYFPSGRTAINFVDTTAMKRTSRLELCWSPKAFLASPDGRRMAVQCEAYAPKNSTEPAPAELLIVNTETEQIMVRSQLKRQVHYFVTPDSRTLITFVPAAPTAPAELQFVDLERAKLVGSLTPKKTVASVALSIDGQYLYLLDSGQPSGNPETNVNGSLSVVSVPARSEVATIDVGVKPQPLILDEKGDQILVLSDAIAAKDQSEGVLRVIKGTKTVGMVNVGPRPSSVGRSPDTSLLYLISANCISVVDLATVKSLRQIRVESKDGWPGAASDLFITPDGRRALAITGTRKLSVFDLEAGRLLANLTVGRGSQLFMQNATAGLQSILPVRSVFIGSVYLGDGQYSPFTLHLTVPPLGGYYESVAVSSDSKYAYVLNSSTYDVTVVDAQNATVLSKINVLGLEPALEMLPGGKFLCVKEFTALTFIDTNTNQKIDFGKDAGGRYHDRLRVGGLRDMVVTLAISPSGTRAIAFAKKKAVSLDLKPVRVLAWMNELQDVSQIVFEQQ